MNSLQIKKIEMKSNLHKFQERSLINLGCFISHQLHESDHDI